MQKNQKHIRLSEMLKSPEMNLVQQLLPLDPYNLRTNKALAAMAVQLNLFDSGDMGIGKFTPGCRWWNTLFSPQCYNITRCYRKHYPPV